MVMLQCHNGGPRGAVPRRMRRERRDEMTPEALTVRCMAWQESGVWVAVCLDFSLAVQGDNPGDVRSKLHEQIASYVNDAMTVDAAHAHELLTRRAPLRDQLRYTFWWAIKSRPTLRRLCASIAARLQAPPKKLAYIEPLPLQVA